MELESTSDTAPDHTFVPHKFAGPRASPQPQEQRNRSVVCHFHSPKLVCHDYVVALPCGRLAVMTGIREAFKVGVNRLGE